MPDDTYTLALTENIEVTVARGKVGVVATFGGGFSDYGATGWAFVVADRLQKRGIDSRVQGGQATAILTVNGDPRRTYDVMLECLDEVA